MIKKKYRQKAYMIAFYDTKKKKFLSNWDPENRCVRYYVPSFQEGTVRLYSPDSEAVIRLMCDLDEKRWITVQVPYGIFSDLLKQEGLIQDR